MAMEALVDYYRKYEKEVPDFTAVVTLGLQTLMTETFKGRDTHARIQDTPMADLLKMGTPGESLPLTFKKEGTGTLFYVARLKYASDLMYSRRAWTAASPSTPLRARRGTAEPPATSFKAGRPGARGPGFRPHQGAPVGGGHRPHPRGPGAGGVLVRHHGPRPRRRAAGRRSEQGDWMDWWKRGGFDHVERHDDRVLLFATRLAEGQHTFNYVCRATTAGTFRTAPAHAEEMYEPEVFGRTATDVIEVKP